jgi:hypothetical protein
MKKISVLASVLFLSAFISSTSYALPGATFDVGVALPIPVGSFSDAAKAGFGVGADAFFGIPMIPIKVGGHVAYNHFAAKGAGSESFSMIEILPSARYSIISLPIAEIYAQAGLGLYHFGSSISGFESQNKFGFNIGAGVSGMFTPTMSFFAMPLYNLVTTDKENSSYVSINLGLKF